MKTALVLGGGGSKGSYQIGVWKALKELGVSIDMVFGSSIGSLNGMLIAQDDYNKAIKLWSTQNTKDIFGIKANDSITPTFPIRAVAGMPIDEVFGYANEIIKGGVANDLLSQIIEDLLNEDALRSSKVSFGLIMTNANSLTHKYVYLKDIPNGEIGSYILASSSVFPVLHSVLIDDAYYIDGGFSDNLPVTMASDMGAEKVICVDLKNVGIIPQKRINLVRDLSKEFVYIAPKWDLGNMLHFNEKLAMRNIKLGYLDAMKAFGVYDGELFTFSKGAFSADNILLPSSELKEEYLRIIELLGEVFQVSPYKLYDKDSFDRVLRANTEEYLMHFGKDKSSFSYLLESMLKLSRKDRISQIALDLKSNSAKSKFLNPKIYNLIRDDVLAATYIYQNLL